MPLLTLLTDFGLQDTYVGVMKGVIYGVCPEAHLVDLTHEIPPQNLWNGRFHLSSAVPYFPSDTVHIAVVDPGVGTQRRAIALKTSQGYFVGPDNGLLILEAPIEAAVVLDKPEFWRSSEISATFHGRDIFAAVGAHLANGHTLAQVGHPIDPASLIQLPKLQDLSPFIQSIDRFGNCITTIAATRIDPAIPAGQYSITAHHYQFPLRQTYGEAASGEGIALVGSHGFIELAVVGGDARSVFGLEVGNSVEFRRIDSF